MKNMWVEERERSFEVCWLRHGENFVRDYLVCVHLFLASVEI